MMGVWETVRRILHPPKPRVVRSWIAEENVADVEAGGVWGLWGRFVGFWARVRTRVFRVLAGFLAVVDLGLAVLLYSNVWYMNLILWAVTVPQFLILIHYLRLTRDAGS